MIQDDVETRGPCGRNLLILIQLSLSCISIYCSQLTQFFHPLPFVLMQLVVLFGLDVSHESALCSVFRELLCVLCTRAQEDLWAHTDSVHAGLVLTGTSLKKTPKLAAAVLNYSGGDGGGGVATSTLLPLNRTLFNLAMETLKLPEEGTVKAAAQFLTVYINQVQGYSLLPRSVLMVNLRPLA